VAANKEPNEGNSQANKKSGVAGYVKNLERGIMLFDNRVLRFGIEDSTVSRLGMAFHINLHGQSE
jgi:hypothetical protein